MHLKRFLAFWLIDYIVAFVITTSLAFAFAFATDLTSVGYLSYVFIPLSTLVFSWLAYKKARPEHIHRIAIAFAWVALSFVFDVLISEFLGGSFSQYLSVFSLFIYGTKFCAVLLGAYLGAPYLAKKSANFKD